MAPADNDRVVSTLPDGLWSPAPADRRAGRRPTSTSRSSASASRRRCATATRRAPRQTRYLPGLEEKKILGER